MVRCVSFVLKFEFESSESYLHSGADADPTPNHRLSSGRETSVAPAGTAPTPRAMPAESVRRPAPATLFTRLKQHLG